MKRSFNNHIPQQHRISHVPQEAKKMFTWLFGGIYEYTFLLIYSTTILYSVDLPLFPQKCEQQYSSYTSSITPLYNEKNSYFTNIFVANIYFPSSNIYGLAFLQFFGLSYWLRQGLCMSTCINLSKPGLHLRFTYFALLRLCWEMEVSGICL